MSTRPSSAFLTCPGSPTEEATVLGAVKCGFESHLGHFEYLDGGTGLRAALKMLWAVMPVRVRSPLQVHSYIVILIYYLINLSNFIGEVPIYWYKSLNQISPL